MRVILNVGIDTASTISVAAQLLNATVSYVVGKAAAPLPRPAPPAQAREQPTEWWFAAATSAWKIALIAAAGPSRMCRWPAIEA